MTEILSALLVLAALAGAAWAFARIGDARESARSALREKLARGDIGPEEYAAHLRALDEAA